VLFIFSLLIQFDLSLFHFVESKQSVGVHWGTFPLADDRLFKHHSPDLPFLILILVFIEVEQHKHLLTLLLEEWSLS